MCVCVCVCVSVCVCVCVCHERWPLRASSVCRGKEACRRTRVLLIPARGLLRHAGYSAAEQTQEYDNNSHTQSADVMRLCVILIFSSALRLAYFCHQILLYKHFQLSSEQISASSGPLWILKSKNTCTDSTQRYKLS